MALDFNTTIVIDSIPAGAVNMSVDLGRSHCTVPDNPRSITVAAGDTADVELAITCEVNWGFLEVGLPTSGPNQPEVLWVTLDGGAIGGAAPNEAGLGFPYVPAGAHTVGLEGVGANCEIAEANPQNVMIPVGEKVQVTFTISCS